MQTDDETVDCSRSKPELDFEDTFSGVARRILHLRLNRTPNLEVDAVVRGTTVIFLAFSICAVSLSQASQNAPATFQRYPVRHVSAAEVEKVLADLLPAADPNANSAIDVRKNELVVEGTAEAHRLARQLLERLDVPQRTRQKKSLKAYRVGPRRIDEAASLLKQRYGDRPGVRITVDRTSGQLLVVAPDELHDAIATILQQPSENGRAAPATPSDRSFATSSTERTAARRPWAAGSQATYELKNARLDQIEPIVRSIFADRMTPRRRGPGGLPGYEIALPPSDGRSDILEIGLDDSQQLVRIEGPQAAVGQLLQLFEALDTPRLPPDQAVRIVALRRAALGQVRRAVDAYRGHWPIPGPNNTDASTKPSAPGASELRSPRSHNSSSESSSKNRDAGTAPAPQNSDRQGRESSGANGPPDTSDASAGAKAGLVRMASAIFRTHYQQQTDGGDRVLLEDPVPRVIRELQRRQSDDGEDGTGSLTQRGKGMDIDVETLPDLDVIILRGRDRDVRELTRIIEEIERASQQAEPEIVVVGLKHAPSGAVARIIASIQQELLVGRQGRATATALEKPNAVLVIGWGESLKAMLELIGKLDRPVAPESQFRVFRLRHARASVISQTISQFYANRQGLGPVVSATFDARSNALIVSASPRDLAEIELLLERLDVPASEAVKQMRIFRLKQSLAEDLAPVLQQAIQGGASGANRQQTSAALELLTIDTKGRQVLKGGLLDEVQITADAHTNTLLVAAPPETMNLIAALIEQLDAEPAAVAQIKVFSIVNGDASSLVEMLRALLSASANGGGGVRLANAPGEPSLAPLRFAVDQRTNSIIASGPPGDLAIVEAILLRLDEAGVETRKSKVYRLRNAPAIDVANSINQFLRSERQVQRAGPGTLSPFRQIEQEVVVVPEPVSNSLILSATPRFFNDIEKLIEDLDAQPPQVMIQVLIAEVDLDDTEELGVELGLQDSLLFDRSLISNIITTTTTTQTAAGQVANEVIQSSTLDPGFNFINEALGNNGAPASLATREKTAGQALSHFAVGRVNGELGYGGLVLSASSESVNVLIRALRQTRRLRVLSRPQVMTLDNQPAFIQVGERVPRIVSTQVTQQAVINSIQLENVGLILGVTPRVSPDGTVVMEVDAEKSSLGAIQDGIPVSILETGETVRSPRINTTTAQTTVSAADGQTIVIGGLITTRKEQISRRVPLLGDLPILGALFRFDSNTNLRSELLIVLTPHVVLSPEDAERIKMEEAARMHWCLSDVHALHGDFGVCDPGNCEQCDTETVVIYPDLNPQGPLTEPSEAAHDSPRQELVPPELVEPQAFRAPPSKANAGNAQAPHQHQPSTAEPQRLAAPHEPH